MFRGLGWEEATGLFYLSSASQGFDITFPQSTATPSLLPAIPIRASRMNRHLHSQGGETLLPLEFSLQTSLNPWFPAAFFFFFKPNMFLLVYLVFFFFFLFPKGCGGGCGRFFCIPVGSGSLLGARKPCTREACKLPYGKIHLGAKSG